MILSGIGIRFIIITCCAGRLVAALTAQLSIAASVLCFFSAIPIAAGVLPVALPIQCGFYPSWLQLLVRMLFALPPGFSVYVLPML